MISRLGIKQRFYKKKLKLNYNKMLNVVSQSDYSREMN